MGAPAAAKEVGGTSEDVGDEAVDAEDPTEAADAEDGSFFRLTRRTTEFPPAPTAPVALLMMDEATDDWCDNVPGRAPAICELPAATSAGDKEGTEAPGAARTGAMAGAGGGVGADVVITTGPAAGDRSLTLRELAGLLPSCGSTCSTGEAAADTSAGVPGVADASPGFCFFLLIRRTMDELALELAIERPDGDGGRSGSVGRPATILVAADASGDGNGCSGVCTTDGRRTTGDAASVSGEDVGAGSALLPTDGD